MKLKGDCKGLKTGQSTNKKEYCDLQGFESLRSTLTCLLSTDDNSFRAYRRIQKPVNLYALSVFT